MFKRIVPFLLTIVFISSCNGQSFREVADPSVRIDIRGASVLPPQEKAWKIIQKSENRLSLIKGNPQSDATYTASVMINELSDFESEEQFSKEIPKKFLSVYDSDRFTIKKEEGEITRSRENYCWTYHLIVEDRAAKTRTGKKVMLLEIIGYICQHPKDRTKGINMQYSHRYYPGDEDPEIKNKAKEFLDNVTFTDFISESFISKAESEAKPHYNRGLAYLRKSQYDEAIIELNKAIEVYPRYALAYNDRGVAYLRKKQYDRAISDFTKALDINPSHHHAHYNRGIAYLDKRNYDEAISDLNKAIELDPTNPEIYYERGFAHLLKNQNDKAIADFNQAITLNPRYAKAFNDRGWGYVRKRQYDQAISDFSKAIEIEPKYNKAYNNRAVAYFYKGEYERAWEDVHKAQSLGLQIHPKFLEDLRKASGREK
jgi:tetratricopeptide (TPR) repeat protein